MDWELMVSNLTLSNVKAPGPEAITRIIMSTIFIYIFYKICLNGAAVNR